MKIIIYGAVSEAIDPPSIVKIIKLRIRQKIYAFRDIQNFKRNKTSQIDYRNYDYPTSTNIGDMAITETIVNYFSKNDLDATIHYCNWNNLYEFNKRHSISSEDWVVIPGGGYFMFSKANELAGRIATDTDVFATTKANVVLFGVGVNRPGEISNANIETPQDSGDSIKRLLRLSKLISVRDLYSKRILEEYTNKPVELIGDPALHLASQLGIGQLTREKRVPNAAPAIGLNFSFHGPTSNYVLEKNIRKYIGFLKELQLATKCTFYYFVHYESGLFIPKLLASNGIHTTVVHGTTSELLKAYEKLDIHIGGMLHSCIFSYSVGVPAIGLAYDIKHLGFFNLFGTPENCLSAFDFDADLLLQRTLHILSAPDLIRDQIAVRRTELKRLAKDFAIRTLTEMEQTKSISISNA